MKKQLIFLSLLFFALTSNAQAGLSSPLTIHNDTAVIDGKNNTWATYMCTSSDTAWVALFSNIADNENIRVFYSKTTVNDCIIKFPSGSVISFNSAVQGVTVSGVKVTLSSTSKGSFVILIVRAGSVYNVSCTRAGN